MRQWLKYAREQKQLTVKEVADQIGISEQYYSQIENGTRQKSLDMTLVSQFSVLFGISVPSILRIEDQQTKNRLMEFRAVRGISLDKLSELTDIPVKILRRLEEGKETVINTRSVAALSEILGVKPSELFTC